MQHPTPTRLDRALGFLGFVAVGALAGTLMTSAALTPREGERPVVEMDTVAPAQTGPNMMALARAHADTHGMTSCGAPADAELDDVFLAVPVDSARIVEVGLDEALDSAGKRHVVLACERGDAADDDPT